MAEFCQHIINNGGKLVITHDKNTDSQAVCMFSSLTESSNLWYCVDSSGQSGNTSIDPSKDGYCVENKTAICPNF